MSWTIECLTSEAAPAAIPSLVDILIDCVDGGASVGFLAPLAVTKATAYWEGVTDSAIRGERSLLVARDAGRAIHGTVQVIPALYENQPHRADISKLLVHRAVRRSGAGEALMRHGEKLALASGRTLLVLDTATPEAARLYERLGWTAAGVIPNYALNPDRTLCDTTFYYKYLA